MSKFQRPWRLPGSRKGTSLIEFSFLVPWYIFLFVGAWDFGFYSYSLIALQDGTRTAAVNASQNSTLAADSTTACTYVLAALQGLPNFGSAVTTCTAAPLTVTATYGATAGPDGGPQVTVTSTLVTPQLFAVPGLAPGQTTISRTVTMRVRG
ncbi:MAG TPA: TadE/TadG family type IV pilus assembly protein [Bryobacteraceae bacterium]|jgi:Flp pilus assembly protein TadG|nr:TadE/TadG family type IV pilus assembly protein [Bryobacteraceae bacterium]